MNDGPNSETWDAVRESENFLAPMIEVIEYGKALEQLLRQHAREEWTGEALEKIVIIRRAASRARRMVTEVHPHRRER